MSSPRTLLLALPSSSSLDLPAPSSLGLLARYEIMSPESIGIVGHQGIVLGKHSGRAAFKERLLELGYEDIALNKGRLSKLVDEAKAIADKKKTVTDQDLEALAGDSVLSFIPLIAADCL